MIRLAPSQPRPPVASLPSLPIHVLTGFLGSGKTTLVNHLLAADHSMRLAVLVNEFGSIDIDSKLISGAAGPVVEMANGCICCATSGDFARGLETVLHGGFDIDGVLIETSGLANPVPVVAAIINSRFTRSVRVAGVIAVVDALNFDDNLDFAEAAYQQLTSADLVLINKCDLVASDIPSKIAASVARLNPRARSIFCTNAEVPPELILGLTGHGGNGFVAEPVHNDMPFGIVVVVSEGPLNRELFDCWLEQMPPGIYRAKGMMRFSGQPDPVVFHLVAGRRSIEPAADLAFSGGAQVVFIGRNLIASELQSGFDRCVAR